MARGEAENGFPRSTAAGDLAAAATHGRLGLNCVSSLPPGRPDADDVHASATDMLRLPLLITGVAGVAGYNALDYFCRRYPRPGDRHAPARQLAIGRAGDRRSATPKIATDWRGCSSDTVSARCSIAPATALSSRASSIRKWPGGSTSKACAISSTSPSNTTPDWSICRSIWFTAAVGAGGHVETDPTDPVTVYGRDDGRRRRVDSGSGCRPACILRISLPMGISFNGHAGAIDWIGSRFKKGKPATLVLRRNPHALLHRLLEPAVRNGAGQRPGGLVSRRRPAAAEPVRDRADHQSRRRLRSRSAVGMHPRAGRSDASASGQRFARFEQAGPALGYEPLDAWPYDGAMVPTDRQWHFERPADEPGSPELLASILYRNPRRRAAAAGRGLSCASAHASHAAARENSVFGETQIDLWARLGL